MRSTPNLVWLLYLLLGVPGCILGSIQLQLLMEPLYISSPSASTAHHLLWYILPSALTGAAVVGLLSYAAQRSRLSGSERPWLWRCIPLLLTVAGLLAFLCFTATWEDFGLFAAFFSWPAVALTAGTLIEPIAGKLGLSRSAL